MSGWKAKRFWKSATAEACDTGFTVRLDGRAVKTPAKAAFVVPTLAMAQAAALEWDAQQGAVKPDTMPVTRAVNSAIDKLVPQFDEVVGLLAAYGASDLLCYRAAGPVELVARQAAAWDPLLDWARTDLGAPLLVTQGIVHIDQPAASVAQLHELTAAHTNFELAAFHDLVAISGSLVLALAVTKNRISADDAFGLSRIDETWQAELWGVDEEAAALEVSKRQAYLEAAAFHALCG
jgi:chaperone required for assembly of F1-ATPase